MRVSPRFRPLPAYVSRPVATVLPQPRQAKRQVMPQQAVVRDYEKC